MTVSKDRLKQPISPFLRLGFKNFFDGDMQNYIGKLKLVTWN